MDIQLIQTCGACPEQYDAYLNDNRDDRIAYLRLRHGYFYVQCGETVVYEAYTKGDGLFEWDEREIHLNLAKEAIKNHYKL